MPVLRAQPDTTKFNNGATLPFGLRQDDFRLAMQDVYDFLFDVNTFLLARGLERLTEVYLGEVTADEFRRNERGDLGTRTATLDAAGVAKLRTHWVCLDQDPPTRKAASRGKASQATSK